MKNTVRRINLEGELGEKFGKVWHLNVKSPAEAIRAIESQRKGLRKYLIDVTDKGIGYEVIVGDQGLQQEEDLLYPAPMRDDFTFVPIPQGGKSRAFGMIMLGVALMIPGIREAMLLQNIGLEVGVEMTFAAAMGEVMGGTAFASSMGVAGWTGTAATMGAAMIFGGVAQLLAPTIESSAGNDEQSYLFDGAQNSVKQGTPVPILYGRLTVGGAVISASIKSNAETSRVPGIPISNGRQFVYGLDAEPGWPGVPGGKGQTMPGMTQID